ncbi:hypothetical protein EDC96DRAFT_442924, partial [Choanephora cucurbitarum]
IPSRYTIVYITNENRTSQTYVYCFDKLAHVKLRTISRVEYPIGKLKVLLSSIILTVLLPQISLIQAQETNCLSLLLPFLG